MTMSAFMAGLMVLAVWVLRPADKYSSRGKSSLKYGQGGGGISINIYQAGATPKTGPTTSYTVKSSDDD